MKKLMNMKAYSRECFIWISWSYAEKKKSFLVVSSDGKTLGTLLRMRVLLMFTISVTESNGIQKGAFL